MCDRYRYRRVASELSDHFTSVPDSNSRLMGYPLTDQEPPAPACLPLLHRRQRGCSKLADGSIKKRATDGECVMSVAQVDTSGRAGGRALGGDCMSGGDALKCQFNGNHHQQSRRCTRCFCRSSVSRRSAGWPAGRQHHLMERFLALGLDRDPLLAQFIDE